MIDLHCHILPGVDDGAKTLAESFSMARFCVNDGITTIVATPHCHRFIHLLRSDIIPRVEQLNADLASAGIRTVIWSTGYRQDFSWIRVPGVLAANGAPYQRQGVSPVPGIYFVGLHRMWEAGSGTLLGCGWAATNVAEHVAARVRASE